MNFRMISLLMKKFIKDKKERKEKGEESWYQEYIKNYQTLQYNNIREENYININTIRCIPILISLILLTIAIIQDQGIPAKIPMDKSFWGISPLINFTCLTIYSIIASVKIRRKKFHDKNISIKNKYIITITGSLIGLAILLWIIGDFHYPECIFLLGAVDFMVANIIMGLPIANIIKTWENYTFKNMSAHDKMEYYMK